jgi:hypothetical protein
MAAADLAAWIGAVAVIAAVVVAAVRRRRRRRRLERRLPSPPPGEGTTFWVDLSDRRDRRP